MFHYKRKPTSPGEILREEVLPAFDLSVMDAAAILIPLRGHTSL